MKALCCAVIMCFSICCAMMACAPPAEARWSTAGKILAGVVGADLLFNGGNSLVGRTVTGIGTVFTGGYSRPCYAPATYGYSPPPPPRRCWDEVRREPGYDRYGNFIGYFDKRVTVCSDW